MNIQQKSVWLATDKEVGISDIGSNAGKFHRHSFISCLRFTEPNLPIATLTNTKQHVCH